jgi:hypothetical protein
MFLSSGGIHGIPSEYVHSIHPQTDRAIFEVENIASVLRQSAGHVLPFCKAPAPWARKPFPIASKCFSEARLVQALRLSHPGSNDRPDQMVENVNI